jgi:hypothetical protein
MTDANTIPNIILDDGGSNELTIYTESVKKTYVKKLVIITPGQSTGNYDAGPKPSKIADLLRIEIRFTVNGFIASADETKLHNLITGGGVFKMTYKSTDFYINIDKLEIDEDPKRGGEQDETSIMYTCTVGEDV